MRGNDRKGNPVGDIEDRRFNRVAFFTELTVRSVSSGRQCKGNSIDLSRGGIGFYSEKYFPPGDRVLIGFLLRGPDGVRSISVAARVARSRVEAEGTLIGAEFEVPLSPINHPVLCECIDMR